MHHCGSGLGLPTAAYFPVQKGKLKHFFDFKMVDDDSKTLAGSRYVLEGIPKSPTANAQKVRFYVDAATSYVHALMIWDAADNLTRFDFSDPVVIGNVDRDEFILVPPAGTVAAHC